MMTHEIPRPTPQDYADIFDVNRQGARIFEDLIKRFARPPGRSGGIDRILDAHEYIGRRQVLEFITDQIGRANGVQDEQLNQGE